MSQEEEIIQSSCDIPEIKLLSWELVGLWTLDIQIEKCAICRNHIMDSCVECQN